MLKLEGEGLGADGRLFSAWIALAKASVRIRSGEGLQPLLRASSLLIVVLELACRL